MTRTLSEDLNCCYTLLFTGEGEFKKNCYMKALLCFEDCRKTAGKLSKTNSVYLYCFFRALRKESQILRLMGLHKRSYRLLKRALPKMDDDWHSTEKLFVLLQLYDLAEEYEVEMQSLFFEMLNRESNALKQAL